jgi:hypothetical protein
MEKKTQKIPAFSSENKKSDEEQWKELLERNSTLDKTALISRVKSKINKISDHRRIVELKYYDLKWWYDIFSIFIIFISAVLTIIEAIKNDVNLEELDEGKKQFLKLSPIFISTGIGFVTSYTKFKRYQENLELIARTTEKGIFTIYRMKKLIEDLHFANHEDFKKKKQLYLDEIFNLYNQTQSELQKTHTFKDIIFYTNKLNKLEIEGEKNHISNNNKSINLKSLNQNNLEYGRNSINNINDDMDDLLKLSNV